MIVGFITTYAISAHHSDPIHGEVLLDTTLCDQVCQ